MEENQYILGARVDDLVNPLDQFKAEDPFNKSWSELKAYNGLDNNFRRRTSRLIDKADRNNPSQQYLDSARADQSGINGAKSKEINPVKLSALTNWFTHCCIAMLPGCDSAMRSNATATEPDITAPR